MKICEHCCGLDKENCKYCNPKLNSPQLKPVNAPQLQSPQFQSVTKQCTNCGSALAEDAVLCVNCGTFVNGQQVGSNVTSEKTKFSLNSTLIIKVLAALLIISFVMVIYLYNKQGSEQITDDLAITFDGFEVSLASSYNKRAITQKLQEEVNKVNNNIPFAEGTSIRCELFFKEPKKVERRGKYYSYDDSYLEFRVKVLFDGKEFFSNSCRGYPPHQFEIPQFDSLNNALVTACFKSILSDHATDIMDKTKICLEMSNYAFGEETDFSAVTSQSLETFNKTFDVYDRKKA